MNFNAYKKGGKGAMSEQTFHREPTETVEQVSKYPFAVLPDRGLTPEILKYYGVRMAMSRDGLSPIAIYFPYHNNEGKLCGYKKRDLSKDKHERGHFSAIGYVGVGTQMFGQRIASNCNKNVLYLAEGEFDVISLMYAIVQRNKEQDAANGTSFAKNLPAIVGLPCGTGNAKAAVASNTRFFSQFKKVVLCLDNDEANAVEKAKGIMKGKEASEDVAGTLMSTGMEIMHVQFDERFKDPNDYIKAGEYDLLARTVVFGQKKYEAEKISGLSSMSFDDLISERDKGAYVSAFPRVMDMIFGVRKRELTVVTALSGAGKTTVVTEIGYSLAEQGFRVGVIFLEEENKETGQRMMARYCGVNYNKYKFACNKLVAPEMLKEAYNWVTKHPNGGDRFYTLDHFGSMRVNELMNKIRHLVYVCGCDYVLLDHLSMVVSGTASKDERKDIDMLMTELAAFVSQTDVGIIAVSHLNRNAADEIRGLSNLEEPKWICVKKEDLRGSAALEQLSWIILGIDFEVMPDRTRGRVRLTVLKNRPIGTLGAGDIFIVDNDTGYVLDARRDNE